MHRECYDYLGIQEIPVQLHHPLCHVTPTQDIAFRDGHKHNLQRFLVAFDQEKRESAWLGAAAYTHTVAHARDQFSWLFLRDGITNCPTISRNMSMTSCLRTLCCTKLHKHCGQGVVFRYLFVDIVRWTLGRNLRLILAVVLRGRQKQR